METRTCPLGKAADSRSASCASRASSTRCAALEVAPAGAGEFDPARRAVEQAHAELALHCGNAARQGGTGHAEVGAGAAEVARARDLYEQGHVM